MHVVERCHDAAEYERCKRVVSRCCRRVGVLIAEQHGANHGNRREDVREENLRRVRPHTTGRSEVRAIFGRLADDGDHGNVRDIREVPSAVRRDIEDRDEHCSDYRVVRELDIVKREQNRNCPRHDEQEGAVAAPTHGLDRVDDCAPEPTDDCVDDGTDRRHDAGEYRVKHCAVGEEEHEVVVLYRVHDVETEVTNTIEEPQRR